MADVRVRDVMTHLVVTLYPEESVHSAALKLSRNRISGAPVVEGGKVVGVVSESDLIRSVMQPAAPAREASVLDVLSVLAAARPRGHEHGRKVSEVMSPVVVEVSPETSIWKAASIMESRGIKRLPVVDTDGFLAGIVSRGDLVRAIGREDEQIRDEVLAAIDVLGPETIERLDVRVREGVATLQGIADRRSTHDLALKLAARTPGVVEVVDRMVYDHDDKRARRVPPLHDPKDPRFDWHPAAEVDAVT